MPRRPANITQADVARVIRAAKQEGAEEVEVRMNGGSSIVIRISQPNADAHARKDNSTEIVL
jgi:hypothetical protein